MEAFLNWKCLGIFKSHRNEMDETDRPTGQEDKVLKGGCQEGTGEAREGATAQASLAPPNTGS